MSASAGDGTAADAARSELYREAARAAVAELDEIETATMALEARLVRLRTRARSLTSLLDVIGELVPDAARAPVPFAPPLAANAPVQPDLPRRRRARDSAPALDGVLEPLGDGRHAGRTDAGPFFEPVRADVDAWG